MERIHLEIDGMSCGHCVGAVKRSLADVQGVSVDAVSVGSADVRFDPARTGQAAIVAAVRDAGYPARVVAAATP